MKFGQLIIRKIVKIYDTRCHILRLKCTKFDSWRLSVCLPPHLHLTTSKVMVIVWRLRGNIILTVLYCLFNGHS